MDIAGLPVKKHSFGNGNVHEVESPMMRIPFSPISSTASSKANMTNFSDELNARHSETWKNTLPTNNMQFTSPSKTASMVAEENKTPKALPIIVPTTPSTVSVPMQTVMTPAAPQSLPFGINVVGEIIEEEIDYSFEEMRAGFVIPKTHIKSMIQV